MQITKYEYNKHYVNICIYIYASPPPKIYLWCFARDMHDETHCILQLIMQWVWSCKFCTPFKEAVSLQHIEHSSKHALLFSEEVQFPFRKLFSLRSIIQYFFQNTRFLLNMQCVINIELWTCALVDAHYNIPWKEKMVLKENVAWTRNTILAKNIYIYMWKHGIHPFRELSLPLIFVLWYFFKWKTYRMCSK